jgi:hypothetical protein
LADPDREPRVALITVLPSPRLVTTPLLPDILLTVATVGTDELQCDVGLTSRVLPSVNVPVAASRSVVPGGTVALAVVIATETKVGGVTVKVDEPVTPAAVVAIVVWPGPTLVASPPGFVVATKGADESQTPDDVRSSLLPSV